MSTFTIEIVTPEKVFLKQEADFAVLPGFSGELGVCVGHMPLMTQLVPGSLRLKRGSTEQTLTISAGFGWITQKQITVFTTMVRS
ncbi:MAG: hypothetical protein JW795_20245 [Chitinivibrionales bacterium]|nr:hypothetical protein [Chitinivibrionales bacterium]